MRSDENGRKRTRGNDEAGAAPASLADIESMLRQALVRIDSLAKKNVAIQTSMGREVESLRDDVKALQEENKTLKWSLKKLASRVQNSWLYPTNRYIQPDEYWQSKGFDEDYIINLNTDFFESIKSAVSNLVHGVCGDIRIGDKEASQVILHDAALEPHWNTLTQHFHHVNPSGTGMEISFENIELNSRLTSQIFEGLRWQNIREIGFFRIQFTNMRDTILALRNLLKKSKKIKSLLWSENPIESVEDMAAFTQMLSDRQPDRQNRQIVLDELRFDENGNENTQALLAGVDLSKYKKLDFYGNNLQTNGRADIPNLIASNSPLEALDLSSNRLNDDDAVLIAESLGHNTRLRGLDLDSNNIQERGTNALLRAVKDTSSMNALSDSNHSCHVDGLRSVINRSLCRQYNRIFKIHHLMAERYRSGEGNVPYLNKEMSGNVSVLLLPFIIESVHRRHMTIEEDVWWHRRLRDTSILGILYELVKDWKMPELFSFN